MRNVGVPRDRADSGGAECPNLGCSTSKELGHRETLWLSRSRATAQEGPEWQPSVIAATKCLLRRSTKRQGWAHGSVAFWRLEHNILQFVPQAVGVDFKFCQDFKFQGVGLVKQSLACIGDGNVVTVAVPWSAIYVPL